MPKLNDQVLKAGTCAIYSWIAKFYATESMSLYVSGHIFTTTDKSFLKQKMYNRGLRREEISAKIYNKNTELLNLYSIAPAL